MFLPCVLFRFKNIVHGDPHCHPFISNGVLMRKITVDSFFFCQVKMDMDTYLNSNPNPNPKPNPET